VLIRPKEFLFVWNDVLEESFLDWENIPDFCERIILLLWRRQKRFDWKIITQIWDKKIELVAKNPDYKYLLDNFKRAVIYLVK